MGGPVVRPRRPGRAERGAAGTAPGSHGITGDRAPGAAPTLPGWRAVRPAEAAMPANLDPDLHLMAAWAAGERSAFELLFERHAPALHRFARRLLGTAHAIRAETVFADSWQPLLGTGRALPPFGLRVALLSAGHDSALRWLRDGSAADNPPPDANAPPPADLRPWQCWPVPARAGPAADPPLWRAAGARLLPALERLPVEPRAAFLLHHDQGLLPPQVAAVQRLPLPVTLGHLRHALEQLRHELGAYGEPLAR
jgi:RNA polymerase sigma-70 factor (ECF subfamily)